MSKKYSDPEITADVYRIVRANQEKTKVEIVKILRKQFGNIDFKLVIQALKELGK